METRARKIVTGEGAAGLPGRRWARSPGDPPVLESVGSRPRRPELPDAPHRYADLDGWNACLRRIRATLPPGVDRLLTNREIQILQLIGYGYVRAEIASLVHLSPKTVDAHRAAIMDKLDIHDRAHLALFAVRVGLADPRLLWPDDAGEWLGRYEGRCVSGRPARAS